MLPVSEYGERAMGLCRPQHLILVVDDELPLRHFVQAMLLKEGYAVITAADGKEALELSRSYPGKIDLIITDITMPRMDGPKLAEHIKIERPDTQILLMSGYASGVLQDYAMAGNFIQKPFAPKALIAKVLEFLNSSEPHGSIGEL